MTTEEHRTAMNEHLPECLTPLDANRGFWLCICKELRACETRVGAAFHKVRADDRKQWGLVAEEQFDAGFTEAITEAMRRVKALPAVVIRNRVGITEAHVIAALKDL